MRKKSYFFCLFVFYLLSILPQHKATLPTPESLLNRCIRLPKPGPRGTLLVPWYILPDLKLVLQNAPAPLEDLCPLPQSHVGPTEHLERPYTPTFRQKGFPSETDKINPTLTVLTLPSGTAGKLESHRFLGKHDGTEGDFPG